MKHPTGLHGYVPRWKGGGAADNSKDVDSDTIKTNLAKMDIKSASANMASNNKNRGGGFLLNRQNPLSVTKVIC